MRRRLVSVLMSVLILMSMLGSTFVVGPLFATNVVSSITSKSAQQAFSNEPVPKQGLVQSTKSNLEPSLQNRTEGSNGNSLNFSSSNVWANLTYSDGNKTRLIVGIDDSKLSSIIDLTRIAVKHNASVMNKVMMNGKVRALVVELELSSATAFLNEVQSLGLASYVEPDMKVQTLFTPDDPQWSLQWGPQKIGADWAWNTTVGTHSVLVAVVDTGIDYNHPDLAANYVPLGYNWAYSNTDPKDDFGHGTHCAGIIAAVINNSVGVAGMAQVRIMAEKVLDSSGWGTMDWVASGIADAVDKGANVISLSLGTAEDSELLHDAVKYAYNAGVLVVAAAGNSGSDVKEYPAAYPEVVSVAATDQNDNTAYFSEYGDWIELSAPGVNVLSTMPTYHVTLNDYGYAMNYGYLSGTSMACPHVAGLAALVWSQYPNRTRDWLRLWLKYTADDLGSPGFDINYGYGRIDARKGMEQAPPSHDLLISGWTPPAYVEPGTNGAINVTVLNFGENDETDVSVQLLANDTLIGSSSIGSLPIGMSFATSLSWSPTVEGDYNVTVYVSPVPGEMSIQNNVVSKYIFVGSPVRAFVVRSAGNYYAEIITNWQELNNEWQSFGDKMIYIDYTALNKGNITYEDLAETGADVLIISCASNPSAGWEYTDAEIEAMTRYVHEGHGLIATAGTFYQDVPNNNKLAPLFGINDTVNWYGTDTDLYELVNASHPIFNHVPNPLIIPRVGTAIPWNGQWDSSVLAGGTYIATGHFKESAIVTYRGLVYISAWLEAIPPYYRHNIQLLYNAITWSRYQKPEHELVVSLECPQHLNPDEPTMLNATVENQGLNNETNVELQLLVDGAMVDSVTIPELPVDSSQMLGYLWTPTVGGRYNVTAYSPPVAGEELIQDNVANKVVIVLALAAKNVLVYSDDYMVQSSSRYVIVALNELGINYTYYADDSSGFASALVSEPWDLVVVDHCNWYSLGYYFNEIDDYVRGGGSLVLSTFAIDGSYSGPTTLWDTLGVQMVSEMPQAEPVYRWTPSHELFTFPNIVGDLWSHTDDYYDHGDHVANTTSTAVGGFTNTYTSGYGGIVAGNIYPTVLFSFILDEFRYSENGDGRPDAVDLWENAIAYVAKGHTHDLAVSLSAESFLSPNDSSLLNATVRNRGLSNETNVEFQLLINGTVMNSTTLSLLQSGSSFTLSYLWTPTTEGTYNVTAYTPPVLGEDVTANNVVSTLVSVRRMIRAAVLGDYYSQLTSLLINNGVLATERDWDVIGDIYDYDVVIINRPTDPGQSIFLDLINAADQYRVGLVFTSSWPGLSAPYGITLLNEYLGDPAGEACHYGWGSVYYQVVKDNPIFEGWNVGDKIYVITSGDRDHAWFWQYSGETIANIGDDSSGIDGGGIAYKIRPNGNKHLLLAGLGPQNYANVVHWTEDAKLIFVRGVWWASNPIVYEHDLYVTLETPASLKHGESSLVNCSVVNSGINNETNVTLNLLINDHTADYVTVPVLSVGEFCNLSYLWTPTQAGDYNITAYSPPVPGEESILNNAVNVTLTVQGIHDVSVTDVEPSAGEVIAGNPVNVGITVQNSGDYPENFNVQAYASPQGNTTLAAYGIRQAYTGTTVYLDPSKIVFNSNDVFAGYRFNVTVMIADVENLYAWQVKMYYNNTMINATRWFEPTWDPQYVFYGKTTIAEQNFGSDNIAVGSVLLGQQPLFNGSGELAIIEFEIVDLPPPGKKYSCPLSINNEDTYLLDGNIDVIPSTLEDGYYEVSAESVPSGYIIGTVPVADLMPGETRVLVIVWNTSTVFPGDYEMVGVASVVPGETHVEDNVFTDGVVRVLAHDVAVLDVTPSRHWVYQGLSMNVSVTVENKGSAAENVTVILYYNITTNQKIGTQVISLVPGENQTIIFVWNTTSAPYCHNYTITAVASIPLDADLSDNTLSDGNVKVRIMGDINGDGKIDVKDIAGVAKYFGATAGSPGWNPDADLNSDGKIDVRDLARVARNFGMCAN